MYFNSSLSTFYTSYVKRFIAKWYTYIIIMWILTRRVLYVYSSLPTIGRTQSQLLENHRYGTMRDDLHSARKTITTAHNYPLYTLIDSPIIHKIITTEIFCIPTFICICTCRLYNSFLNYNVCQPRRSLNCLDLCRAFSRPK